MKTKFTLLLVALCFFSYQANATDRTFQFYGTIATSNIPGVSAGDPFVATLSYDDTQSPFTSIPGVATYANYAYTITVSGLTFSKQANELLRVDNDFGIEDAFTAGGIVFPQANFVFRDLTQTAFASTALPTSLSLANFAEGHHVHWQQTPTSGFSGVITSITSCVTDPIVTTNADAGPGSLRQAVLDACPGSTITFDMNHVTSPISLSNGQIIINKNLTIQGPGATLLTVQNTMAQSSISRVFNINAGVTAAISNLTISGGNCTGDGINGGGILNKGILTATNSTISGNTGTLSYGGGIATVGNGITSITNSTITGNTSRAGGGIFSEGTMNLVNSTVSGNTATLFGGGIHLIGTNAIVNVINSTISDNTAPSGGGIFRAFIGTANLLNSIIAGNTAGDGPDFAGSAISQGNNLIGKTDGSSGWVASDFTGTVASPLDPVLGALGNNGGPTMTYALLPGSPAINAGTNTGAPVTDQRGITRPKQTTTDIGAFESQGFNITVSSGNNQSTVVNTAFANPLAVTVTSSFSEPVDGGIVTFTPPASGASSTIAGNPATIINGSATTGVVTANEVVGGPYTVTAAAGDLSTSFSLTNNEADPCADITPISCATPTTFSLSGSGIWIPETLCFYNTYGKEKIYSFTAPTTGTYQLQVTNVTSNPFVDYFYKAASGGCGPAGWTCINDNSGYPFGPLTAGVTYYFLVDSETLTEASQTFQIICPADPCNNIQPISCAAPVTVTASGTGIWDIATRCNVNTPGQERVYSFTPPVTGNYSLQVTAASGGYGDYFYKEASDGCSPTGWTCVAGSVNGPQAQVFGPLTAGTTYYIVFDPQVTTPVTQTFQINCPADPCNNIQPISCATPVTSTHTGGGVWEVYACGSYFSQRGQERIYSFKPATSGPHVLEVTSAGGGASVSGYIHYFYKLASEGCNTAGWTCISMVGAAGSYPIGTLTAGTTYYILLDESGVGFASQTFQITCPPPTATYTIFPPTPVDPNLGNDNGRAIELGVKFRVTQAGFITGVRFYKKAGNNGTHIGHLWSNTGTKLAEATFTGETSSGWQQVLFSNPVAVSPGITYVAGYFSSLGYYNVTRPYFTSAVVNGPIRALADGEDGSNGVFRYTTVPAFPNSSNQKSNFWVDVLFSTIVVPDGTPPTVLSVSPANNASGINTNTSVSAVFSEAMNPNTISTATFELRNSSNVLVPATVSYNAGTNTATLTPSSPLAVSNSYTAKIKGGASGVADANNIAMASDYSWSFATAGDVTAPTIVSNSPLHAATSVSINTTVSAGFSEAMNAATITTSTFELRNPSNVVITATVVYNAGTKTATLTPSSPLANSTTYTAKVKGGTPGVKDAANNAMVSDYQWSFTTASSAPVTTFTIFPPAAVDPNLGNDGMSIEVGVKFRVTQSGFIRGIRFYKKAGNTGTHIGHLWSSTGTMLAAASFTGETASGWQQVLFSSPVAINPNTTYVASYFSSAGFYNVTRPYFTSAVVNGPLRALANGEHGSNGVFRFSSTSAFPNSGNNASNFWVDVVFTTGPAPRLIAPELTVRPDEKSGMLTVKVTPNPGRGMFKLIAMSDDDKTPIKVRITDISGRVLEQYEKVAAGSLLQVGQSWRGGVYFAEVIQGNQRRVVKIIKVN